MPTHCRVLTTRSNAPATFQQIMDAIQRHFVLKFDTIYLGDACMYNRTIEEHIRHLRLVLQRFKEEGLHLRLKTLFLFGLQ
jgi:hypothetical protein